MNGNHGKCSVNAQNKLHCKKCLIYTSYIFHRITLTCAETCAVMSLPFFTKDHQNKSFELIKTKNTKFLCFSF